MAVSDKYQKWIEWIKKKYPNEEIALTGSQVEIAEYVLNNEILSGNESTMGMLQGPGDKITVIKSIQQYLKD